MSDHITANGTGSPSLLNSLRNFRFQKKFSQDSPNAETPDLDSVEIAEKQPAECDQPDSSSKTPPPSGELFEVDQLSLVYALICCG